MNIRRILLATLAGLTLAGSAQAASILLEAENSSATGGGRFDVKTDRPGSSGGKALAGWDDTQQWLEWSFEVPESGDYLVTLRYAGGRDWAVWRELKLDGKVPAAGFAKVELKETGGWGRSAKDWKNLTIAAGGKPLSLKLAKGSHVLRLTSLGGAAGNGSANLDAVVLHSAGTPVEGLLQP